MTALSLEGAPARVRTAWLVPALVAVVAGAVAWWASAPYIVGVFHDDGVYALLGKSIATGHGFHYLQLPGLPAATHYPPGYPLLLAALWWLSPTFPDNVPLMLAANAVCIGVAALGFQQLLHRWLGWRAESAGLVALVALLGVPVLTLSTALMSEPLFLACFPPVLYLAERALSRADRRSALEAGAAMGALMLVRMHAIALLGAAGLLLLARRDWRRALWLGGAAVAVQLPWMLWCRIATPHVAPPLNGTYGAYPGWFMEGWRMGGLPLLLGTIRVNARELWLLLGDRLWGGLGRTLGLAAVLSFAALMVVGAWRSARRSPLLALFLALYFALVLVMSCAPYRYAWGVWPLLVVLAVVGGEWIVTHRASRGWRVAALLLLVVPFGAMARTELRGFRTREWSIAARDASRPIAPVVEWIRRNTPPDAAVLVEGEEITTLFTGRQAAPPAPFTELEYLVPLTADDHLRGLVAMLAAVPARYVVTLNPGIAAAARRMPALRQVDSLPGAAMFLVQR